MIRSTNIGRLPVFDELLGLPAHPLLVHSAVVFVPLLALVGVVYALVPYVRRWIEWAAVGLSVVAPFAAWFATLSGNNFRNKLASEGIAQETLTQVDEHRDFGDKTLWAVIGLAVLTVLLVALRRFWASGSGTGKLIVTIVVSVGLLGFAGAGLYYVYKTGDTGARIVWGTG
jgi:hypothetical protein